MKKKPFFVGYAALFFLIVGSDRITKYLMQRADTNYFLNYFLSLRLQYNRGISWGMLHSENEFFFTFLTLLIGTLIALFFWYTATRFLHNHFIVGEIMVCAGALSNIIDRVWYGGVADFILFSVGTWSFPIFNIADVFIVSGLGIMMIQEFFYDKN
jgi:signal peptidase II